MALVSVQNLSVSFGAHEVVHNTSFEIEAGKTLALVGESGSGKSVSALSIMKLLPYPYAHHATESKILFDGVDVLKLSDADMRRLRGKRIGMIFQEPMTALNPLHTIYQQIAEPLVLHQNLVRAACVEQVRALLELVGLNTLQDRLNAYPHQLSGGQRQRVMIAMALANRPELLIADEPTTALDVTVQAQILELLQNLQQKFGMSLLLITHDLGIVRHMADSVVVMQHGHVVEQGSVKAVFETPQHAYTQKLLSSRPSGTPQAVAAEAPTVVEAENVSVRFAKDKPLFGKPKTFVDAVKNIDLTLKAGETLGIVGESGSGKTTLGFSILNLVPATGRIVILGQDMAQCTKHELRAMRAKASIVFQDPFGALSPRLSVGQIIAEGLEVHEPHLPEDVRLKRVEEALISVQLPVDFANRFPHELSGGQRQRVAIARALILKPAVLVLDEPTSALDMSVQSEVVDLLRDLQQHYGLAYLFISHDLAVIRAMSHRIMVMKNGECVEKGHAAQVLANPQNDYTKRLFAAAFDLKAVS